MNSLRFSTRTKTRLVDSGLDIVVTGGGGWLGQATLEMLESALGAELGSRVHVFGTSRRSMTLRSGATLEVRSLPELIQSRFGPRLVAHFAFATREHVSMLGISEFIARNEGISALVGEHVTNSRPVGLMVVSSGAVHMGDDLAANPYGVLKARDERRFLDVANPDGRATPAPRVIIPRLFNLAGPFLNKPEHYVLGSIIEDIVRGGPIELRATHPVVRSYVHVRDVVELGFAAMLGNDSLPDAAFDTAGEREVEVGELAELAVSLVADSPIEIHRPPMDGSAADRYVGNPAVMNELARSLGLELQPLAVQIEETADYLGI